LTVRLPWVTILRSSGTERPANFPWQAEFVRVSEPEVRYSMVMTMTTTIGTMFATLALSPAGGEGQKNSFVYFVPYILIFVVFYFLLIAPARKKQKKHSEMLENLKNGDRVITNGGIHGTVVGLADGVIQVRIADQVKIEVSRNAVAALQSD
jgi:preprotein translocase subunit YajC